MKETTALLPGKCFWYVKTEEQIEAERQQDRDSGRYYDAAGEPLLYSRIGSGRLNYHTIVTVLKKKNVGWPHWSNKPTRLTEGLATISGIPRLILFQR